MARPHGVWAVAGIVVFAALETLKVARRCRRRAERTLRLAATLGFMRFVVSFVGRLMIASLAVVAGVIVLRLKTTVEVALRPIEATTARSSPNRTKMLEHVVHFVG